MQNSIPGAQLPLTFDGPDYKPEYDDARLTGQALRIFDLMKDEKWRTLQEIQEVTGDMQASISAQLRHLRKPKFGDHLVDKRARGDRSHGLFEYQLIPRERLIKLSQLPQMDTDKNHDWIRSSKLINNVRFGKPLK